ncbi:DUF6231 family protein [Marinobacter confluentis]|uniref:Uncharacterized protein n=1 Tax=Marinobacter confluentis TaxID=1697557 RepID=A0A4Z1CG98_9GAMM|nr:DUF6231 family protein [Marinobacter confluentis]TGN39264.1 hypothetical protein E5Q11_11475 [Marinobacter confluentis]
MTTSHQALARIVDTCQPNSLVVCGETAGEVGQHWYKHHPSSTVISMDVYAPNAAFPLAATQDLALVTGTLENISHEEGGILLGHLRNYGTHQIAVVVDPEQGWDFKDFIGLGFRRQAELDDDGIKRALYTYNIDNYNHKRAWNNPKNWANPEMWGKAWW